MLLAILKKAENGQLTIIDGEERFSFGVKKAKEQNAEIKVLNQNFYKRVILFGDIGLGESYTANEWETPALDATLYWFLGNSSYFPNLANSVAQNIFVGSLNFINKLEENKNLKNTLSKAQKNISYHYDLSNDFFSLMLDKTMAYSSGIYDKKHDTLEKAQINKFETICQKLQLDSQSNLLEIGSGWGGFALYAAKKYKCKVTTLTISQEQYKYVKELIKKEKVEKSINVVLQDYRTFNGKFDKIVSIEMIEAIGYQQMKTYLTKCDDLLAKGGTIVLQAITYPDHYFDKYVKGVNWIQKHIFPGSHLVSIEHILRLLKKHTKITLYHLETISSSYAKTLRAWKVNVEKNKKQIMKLGMDEPFFLKWIFYLVYCEVGFNTNYINDVQIVLTKEKDNFTL